jgi:hypothetical protein
VDSRICDSEHEYATVMFNADQVIQRLCLCASAATYSYDPRHLAEKLRSIRDQEVPSSNLGAPTKSSWTRGE